MRNKISLEEFNKKYRYRLEIGESWEIPEESDDGYIYADCDSYILYLKYRVEGFENIQPYFCMCAGNGHLIGKLYGQWIDCNLRRLTPELKPYYTDFRKISKLELWLKMLSTKLFGKVLFVK